MRKETTNGIFAPWAIYKDDFLAIGGHDPLYAPQSKEDSDIFNRFLLAGYKFVQTWEGFVYHMTCRGSRFADGAKRNPNGEVFMKNRETDEKDNAGDDTEYKVKRARLRDEEGKWVNEYVKEEQALKVKAQQNGYLNLFRSNYPIENPFKYDEPIGLYTQGEPQYSFDRYREQMDDKNKKLEEAFDNLSSIRVFINSSIETNATEGKSRIVRRSSSCMELSTISQGFNSIADNSRPNSTY